MADVHTNCKYFAIHKTGTNWWLDKINKNCTNAVKAINLMKKNGWEMIAIWECKLKPAKLQQTLIALVKKLS